MQNIPGQRGLNIDELDQWAGLVHFGQQAEAAHIQQLRRGSESPAIEAVQAKHHVVHVQLFGDAINRGARRMQFDRDAEAVVGTNAVFAWQHKQRGGIQALLQQLGKGVADPLDARSLGLIFKGNYQHVLPGSGRTLGKGGRGQEQKEDCAEPEKFQGK